MDKNLKREQLKTYGTDYQTTSVPITTSVYGSEHKTRTDQNIKREQLPMDQNINDLGIYLFVNSISILINQDSILIEQTSISILIE